MQLGLRWFLAGFLGGFIQKKPAGFFWVSVSISWFLMPVNNLSQTIRCWSWLTLLLFLIDTASLMSMPVFVPILDQSPWQCPSLCVILTCTCILHCKSVRLPYLNKGTHLLTYYYMILTAQLMCDNILEVSFDEGRNVNPLQYIKYIGLDLMSYQAPLSTAIKCP